MVVYKVEMVAGPESVAAYPRTVCIQSEVHGREAVSQVVRERKLRLLFLNG